VFEEVGGFREVLAVDFNDVDFCLKVRAAGYRIVFTPYATLYHHESASFGPRLQRRREIGRMQQLWGDAVACDPYYNPNLSRDFPDYRLP
jgi:GT2 family glycosyltransferase